MSLHVTKKSVLAVTGALLLAIGVTTLAVTAKIGKSSIGKELDEKMYDRIARYRALSTFDSEYMRELISTDMEQYTLYQGEDMALIIIANDVKIETNDGIFSARLLTYPYEIDEINEDGTFSFVPSTETGKGIPYITVTDANGDTLFIWNNHMYVMLSGYSYNLYYMNMGDSQSSSISGMNDMSTENTELAHAAEELLGEDKTGGWYEDYRYTVITTSTYMGADGTYQYVTDAPYETTENDEPTGRLVARSQMIFFEDGSGQLKTWRSDIIFTALIALAAWVVVMAVLAILLTLMEKNRGVNSAPTGDSDEDTPAELIPDALAKALLEQISQNEGSMGPNGYLDQMRDLIQSHMSDS